MTRLLHALESTLFPARMAGLRVVLVAFLAVNAVVRIGLAAFNGDPSFFLPWKIVPAMLIGALFDLGAATGREHPADALAAHVTDEAVSYYEIASRAFKLGELKLARRP